MKERNGAEAQARIYHRPKPKALVSTIDRHRGLYA
jgi:hypothetical protein